MLGRGNQHGVNTLIIQQTAKVSVGPELGSQPPDGVKSLRVDIGRRHALRIRTPQSGLKDLCAPGAGAD